MPNERVKPVIPTTELVMKTCLIVSVVVGTLIIFLAAVGNRAVLSVSTSVVGMVAVQWIFYVIVRAKRRSD